MSVERKAPYKAGLQWRWEITEREFAIAVPELLIDLSDIDATPIAKAHATDNRVDLRFVTGTGVEGRKSKQDVVDYIKGGKPIPDLTETRMPRIREIVAEARDAKLIVAHRLKHTAFWLWEDCVIVVIDGRDVPVYFIEWGLRGARGPASRLKDRDTRFGLLLPRAEDSWHGCWSPRI